MHVQVYSAVLRRCRHSCEWRHRSRPHIIQTGRACEPLPGGVPEVCAQISAIIQRQHLQGKGTARQNREACGPYPGWAVLAPRRFPCSTYLAAAAKEKKEPEEHNEKP